MNKLNKQTLLHCAAGVFLANFLLIPGTADAGLVKNETTDPVCMKYFGLCQVTIAPESSKCLNFFADFPAFESNQGLYCPIPFFTKLTTVRIYYSNDYPVCSRDKISNKPCERKKSAAYAPQNIRLDANSDGAVSRAEYMAAVTQDFHRADVNGDNILSRLEMSYQDDTPIPMDTNKDDFVSLDEAVAGVMAIFDDLDKDGDGVLSNAESND